MPAGLTLYHYLIVSGLLFGLGVFGVLARRNAIAVFLGLELMLNAAALNFVVFWHFQGSNNIGPIFALMIITVAAAEAAVGLAIVLNIYRRFQTVDVDEVNLMDG